MLDITPGNAPAFSGPAKLVIGNCAGHHFAPGDNSADLTVSRHCERRYPDGRVEKGFFVTRKWMRNRAAFNYDKSMGWEVDSWFEWPGSDVPVPS